MEKIKKSKKATEDIAEEGKVYALCGREYQNDSELDAIIKSLNIKLDKTLLWEILLERIVKNKIFPDLHLLQYIIIIIYVLN